MSTIGDPGFYNVGTDHTLVITNQTTGARVTLDGRRTRFTHKAKDEVFESKPVDAGGLVDHRVMPGGWQGTIEVDRNNDSFSALVAFLEANIYAGGIQDFFSITSYEPKADKSSIAIYQYQRVVFHGYDPGAWARETVKPVANWEAQQRVKLA